MGAGAVTVGVAGLQTSFKGGTDRSFWCGVRGTGIGDEASVGAEPSEFGIRIWNAPSDSRWYTAGRGLR